MATSKTKQIKLQTKYRALWRGYKKVPWLSINGIWLEKLGFKIGDTVNIISCDKRLIIEVMENQIKTNQETPKKRIK